MKCLTSWLSINQEFARKFKFDLVQRTLYSVHASQVKHVFLSILFSSKFSSHFSFVSIFASSLRILRRKIKCLFQASPKKFIANIFGIFLFISVAEENIYGCCWYSLFGLTLIIIIFFNDTFWAHVGAQTLNIKSKHIIAHNGITHGVQENTNNASIRPNIRMICCDLSCDLLLIYQFKRIQTHIHKVSWMVINACNIQRLHAIDFRSMMADLVNDTVVPRAY